MFFKDKDKSWSQTVNKKDFQGYQKVLDLLATGDLLLLGFFSNDSTMAKVKFEYRDVNRLILELNQLCRLVWNFAKNPAFKILIYVPENSMILFFKEIVSTLKCADKIVLVRTISGILKHKSSSTLLIVLGLPDEMLLRKAVASGIHLIYGIYSKGNADISAQYGFYRMHNNILGVKSLSFLVALLDEILWSKLSESSSKSVNQSSGISDNKNKK